MCQDWCPRSFYRTPLLVPPQALSPPRSGLFYKRVNMWAPKPDCLCEVLALPLTNVLSLGK